MPAPQHDWSPPMKWQSWFTWLAGNVLLAGIAACQQSSSPPSHSSPDAAKDRPADEQKGSSQQNVPMGQLMAAARQQKPTQLPPGHPSTPGALSPGHPPTGTTLPAGHPPIGSMPAGMANLPPGHPALDSIRGQLKAITSSASSGFAFSSS